MSFKRLRCALKLRFLEHGKTDGSLLGGSWPAGPRSEVRRLCRLITASLLVFAVAGCGGGDSSSADAHLPPVTPTRVTLDSDPGDYIGQGRHYAYTRGNSTITVTVDGDYFTIDVEGGDSWFGRFTLPGSLSRFQVGTYAGLTNATFSDPAVGALEWYGNGRGNNTIKGSITVNQVNYFQGNLIVIDLSFEQHSEGVEPALRGHIVWDSRDTSGIGVRSRANRSN